MDHTQITFISFSAILRNLNDKAKYLTIYPTKTRCIEAIF